MEKVLKLANQNFQKTALKKGSGIERLSVEIIKMKLAGGVFFIAIVYLQ